MKQNAERKTDKAKAKTTTTAKETKTKADKPSSKGKLGELLGHSVVSVVRAMGKAGWDFDTAKAALEKAGVAAAEHTIRVGLKRGRDNDPKRRIAPLSAKELDTLRATPKVKAKNATK